ncbi:MAG: hypothetical protein HND47_09775 [Chloroflexi bacterium]|nr:hypothetical protein [Chloroflexota bacterium]
MPRKILTFITSIFLVAALSACNLPNEDAQVTGTPDVALTITAISAPSSTPSTLPNTAPPTLTFTPEFTSTPSVPQVTVSTNTNCRTGPGTQYDLIDALLVGQTAEVVGKNSGVPNYWVIKRLNGSGTCWLWGQYATVTGNTANLTEFPVPPTPTPKATNTPTVTSTPVFAVTSVNFINSGGCGGGGFTATANITTNGPGTITYTWKFSDGASVPNETMVFASAGTQSDSYTWTTTASGTHWIDIFIITPNNQQFGRASFTCP